MKVSTYFALLAEFGTGQIPLEAVCERYFGLNEREAKRKACMQQLPVPVFRIGSQKSGWLVSAEDLANRIDEERENAAKEREKMSV